MQDLTGPAAAAACSDPFPSRAPTRLLVFADNFGPSQAIAFVEGLARARAEGRAAVRIIEEAEFGPDQGPREGAAARQLVEAQIAETGPTALVISRFGHAGAWEGIRQAALAHGLPVIAHIDDDLFDLPVSAGIERYRLARHPRRLRALQLGLQEADLVMAATPALAAQLAWRLGHARIGWLENGTAGRPLPRSPKPPGQTLVIGYMGSASHGVDLEMIAPALNQVLARRRDVRLELFGSIARQGAADLLPAGVIRHDVVSGDYGAFRRKLAALDWDIGLAPLQASPYNRCKTATKWAEYAEAGAAVLASEIEVYQPMFEARAALPARPDGWAHALERLIASPGLRAGLTAAADQLLAARYGWERLEASVLNLVERRPGRRAA
jgi:glycosyltransferase involved in cell wall biosynthesis